MNRNSVFCLVVFIFLARASVLREKPHHHERLTKRELAQSFGVESHDEVPMYNVVNLEYDKRRLRRSASEGDGIPKPVSIVLNAFGTKLLLNLTLNKNLIAKKHTIEFYNADGKVEKYAGFDGEFSTGVIADDPGSFVALHHNNRGLSGTVLTKKDAFYVSPLPRRLHSAEGNHVLFRRTDIPSNHKHCGTDDQLFPSSIRTIDSAKREASYHHRSRRATKPIKTMELMMVADYTMVNFYTKEFLPSYLISLANVVAGLFRDSSLEYPIDVVVTRTVIFDTNQFPASTISDLLAKFNEWVKLNNIADDKHIYHADNAVLMTRKGCIDGCLLEGLAYNGLCTTNAVSVSKDRGLMAALTVAHEIAHNINTGHDTTTECPDGVNIMATGSSTGAKVFKWSQCSSNSIKVSMESSKSSCFNDKPVTHQSNSSFQLYGQVYDGDKQCEFALGKQYKHCTAFQNNCQKLYCQDINVSGGCLGLSLPPAHGTYCGENKWCIHTECVPDGSNPAVALDGEWGAWSEYNTCSEECGIGIQFKERTCNNPVPANGGADCKGSNKGFYKTCNTHECTEAKKSLRLQQCQNLKAENQFFEDPNNACMLVCGTSSNAYYHGYVADGTKCYENADNNDLCIQGKCEKLGCDLQLLSNNNYDRCGVCRGDGSTCQLHSGSDNNTYESFGEYHLTDIPANSRDIEVIESAGTFNFLGFKVGESNELAIPLPTYSTNYNLEGAIVKYDMEAYVFPDKLTISEPLPIGIRVYLVNYYQVPCKGLEWKYYAPASSSEQPLPSYNWKPSDWSTCTKDCAGGEQERTLSCVRTDDNTNVNNTLCSSIDRPPVVQACNIQNCPPMWHLTEWSTCSKLCGKGTQSRRLYCSELTATGEQIEASIDNCESDIPEIPLTGFCNEVMCPAVWVPSAWSECSKTCKGGHQSRSVKCQRINADGAIITASALECTYHEITPDTVQSCSNDVECPRWKTTQTECSKTCGGGVSSYVEPVCTSGEFNDIIHPESDCGAEKPEVPSGKIPCNTESCEIDFHWIVVEGACSVTCGNGMVLTSIKCERISNKEKVTDDLCDATTKPAIPIKTCSAGICAEQYSWDTKMTKCLCFDYGGGKKSNIAICKRKSDDEVVDDIYCDAAVKPENVSHLCTTADCPIHYEYKVEYEKCSVTCGQGTQKAILACYPIKGSTSVDSSMCEGVSKPSNVTDITCNMDACPATYSWRKEFGACSVTCGNGVQDTIISCIRDEDSIQFADSLCDVDTKPDMVSQQCLLKECLTPWFWRSNYGHCTADCGEGYKLSIIECVERSSGGIVAPNFCVGLDTPPQQKCKIKDCAPAFRTTNMSPSYPLGCYNDIPSRRVPNYIANFIDDYNKRGNATEIIERCAMIAETKGYDYFSLQYHGECWAGNAAVGSTYYKSGVAHNCKNGIGGSGTNFVYKIGSPEVHTQLYHVVKLGCYGDNMINPRPMPVLVDNYRESLKWTQEGYAEVIARCAYATRRRGWGYFGIQYYGECWSGEGSENTYHQCGVSDRCVNGLGGEFANFVYGFYPVT